MSQSILTLQFGHYTNFVGTHWWNIQESEFTNKQINHDVLYREGINLNGQITFTPRLLLYDLKSSLNGITKTNNLYPEYHEEIKWPNPIETIEKPLELTEFQKDLTKQIELKKSYNFEQTVNVWSDFLYTQFHPRTINLIREYEHENLEKPFNTYPLGEMLWKTINEPFTDRIRLYIEECDHFAGFHIMSDCLNGFGGLSNGCLEYLNDEYEHKTILTIPIIPSHLDDSQDLIRLINLTLSFAGYQETSSLVVPLSTAKYGWRQLGVPRLFNHLDYNENLYYHSTAILASAIDTITMLYRLKQTNYSINNLCMDLNGRNRKISSASLCLPFYMNINEYLIDCLNNWNGMLTQSITPNCELTDQDLQQIMIIRGLDKACLKKPPSSVTKLQQQMAAYKCDTIEEMFNYYYHCNTFYSMTNVVGMNDGLPVKQVTFPKFFDHNVGNNDVDNVPVLAGLHNGPFVGDMIESLYNETKRLKFRKFHQFQSIDYDHFNDLLEEIAMLRDNYLV